MSLDGDCRYFGDFEPGLSCTTTLSLQARVVQTSTQLGIHLHAIMWGEGVERGRFDGRGSDDLGELK